MQTRELRLEDEHANEGSPIWEWIRSHLTERKMAIYEEISSYPAPIAGCDQQFNYLLEQRSNVQSELARLNQCVETGELSIADFVDASAFIDRKTKELFLQEVRR